MECSSLICILLFDVLFWYESFQNHTDKGYKYSQLVMTVTLHADGFNTSHFYRLPYIYRDTVAMGWDQTLIKIDEKGATFRSYVDGSIHHLTPERSIDIQRQLGADLIVGKI